MRTTSRRRTSMSWWRGLLIVVACAFVGQAVGTGYSALKPERFQSGSQVLLTRSSTSALLGLGAPSTDTARLAANNFQVLSSGAVLRSVEEEIGRRLDVRTVQVEGSDVANIIAVAESPDRAQEAVTAYANAFLRERDSRDRQVLMNAREEVEGRLSESTAQLKNVEAELANAATLPEPERLQAEARLGPDRERLLREQLALRDVLLQVALQSAVIESDSDVQVAPPPVTKTGLTQVQSALLGLAGGLVIGVWIVWRRLASPRLGNAQDPTQTHPWRRPEP